MCTRPTSVRWANVSRNRCCVTLTTDPAHPTARLHLLGQDRVGVDTGDRAYTLFRNVPHPVRGSLLVMGNRVTRAELWVTDRRNVTMWDWIPA